VTDDDTGTTSTTVPVTVLNDDCCDGLAVHATIDDPNPGPVDVGESFTWDLSATFDPPTAVTDVTSTSWEWTVQAVWTQDDAGGWVPDDAHDVTINDPDPSDADATLTATVDTPGLKKIDLRVTLHLTGTDALGDPCECEGSDDKSDQKEVPGVILEKTPQAFIPKGGAESNEVTITAKAVGGV